MPKRGRKLAGASPKRNYGTKLSDDVLAIIRAQPNQAEFLERLVRESDRQRVPTELTGLTMLDGSYILP